MEALVEAFDKLIRVLTGICLFLSVTMGLGFVLHIKNEIVRGDYYNAIRIAGYLVLYTIGMIIMYKMIFIAYNGVPALPLKF